MQGQLNDDAAAIQFANDLEHAANAQVVDVLSRCVGERLPVDREACRRWWFKRLGQTPIRRAESLHPTLTEMVPLITCRETSGDSASIPLRATS